MDYYNLTVFEWITDKLGAQGTVCGGGRYDGLIEQLGGGRRRRSASAWAWSACCCCWRNSASRRRRTRRACTPSCRRRRLFAGDDAGGALRAAGIAVLMNAGFAGMKARSSAPTLAHATR